MAYVTGPTASTTAPGTFTDPWIVPAGVRARVTAASTSRRPSPHTPLSAAVPPQARSAVSTAVRSRRSRVRAMSETRAGLADHMRATAPATCGAAIDVPFFAP